MKMNASFWSKCEYSHFLQEKKVGDFDRKIKKLTAIVETYLKVRMQRIILFSFLFLFFNNEQQLLFTCKFVDRESKRDMVSHVIFLAPQATLMPHLYPFNFV